MSDYLKYTQTVKIGQLYDWVPPENPPSSAVYTRLDQRNYVHFQSVGNPMRNGKYVSGGNFMSVKRTTSVTPSATCVTWRPGWGIAYKGRYVVAAPTPSLVRIEVAANNSAMTSLSQQGAVAWNRMRPDNPDFSLATSLGEMKDLPGMFKDAVKGVRDRVRSAGKKPKSGNGKSGLSKTGQYYLALQFGWLPLLRDIQNFVKAQQGSQKRLDQLIRDNGKPIKRTTQISNSSSVGSTSLNEGDDGWGGNLSPLHVTQCYKRYANTYRNYRTSGSAKTWGEAVFRYHLPPGPRTVVWKKKMLRRIMGSRVTPETVYNLMPWSWLIDYFIDLGQFIKATSPGVADRLAADYAYVMRTETWTETREANSVFQGAKKENASFNEAVCFSSVVDVRKMRHRASPFGWGVSQSSLSLKQLAILGALGLSKLP